MRRWKTAKGLPEASAIQEESEDNMKAAKRKEDVFYTMYIQMAGKILEAAETFIDLLHNYENIPEKISAMKILETECDSQSHDIMQELKESFITPFDREDISEITREMDDIVDCLEEAANAFDMYGIKEMKPEAQIMAEKTVQAIRELDVMFRHLSEIKKNKVVLEQIVEINRIENEGDILYRKYIKELFEKEKDPIELIKWRHIYQLIEDSLDSCENVANILEAVVLKFA